MKTTFIATLLVLSIVTSIFGQLPAHLSKNTGFKLSVLVSGQEITNIPSIRPRGRNGDTVIYNQAGSEAGKIGAGISYFWIRPLTRHLLLQTYAGFRQRGFVTDSKFNNQTGYATPSALNTNRLSSLFVDVGLRLQTGAGRKTTWFASFSNRIDYLAASRLPFWGDTNPYRKIEFSPVGQVGFGFRCGPHGRRCFIELEGNPGVMNVLKTEPSLSTQKPVGSFPVSPISSYQKIGRNYSMALEVSIEW
ncbi:MAG: hypothetical protein LH609_05745, partial [Rudanella sp.]|nr:hypothetical protein [Rudanella sp.]